MPELPPGSFSASPARVFGSDRSGSGGGGPGRGSSASLVAAGGSSTTLCAARACGWARKINPSSKAGKGFIMSPLKDGPINLELELFVPETPPLDDASGCGLHRGTQIGCNG